MKISDSRTLTHLAGEDTAPGGTLHISAGVITIAYAAFDDCNALQHIYVSQTQLIDSCTNDAAARAASSR